MTVTHSKRVADPATVIVLSGRRTAETLKAAGLRVGLVSPTLPWDLALLVDVPIQADPEDWEALAQQVGRVHRSTPIAAVVTHLERLLPIAGRLRDALGLPGGITEQAARNCMDKATTNTLLRAAGLPVADSRVVTAIEQVSAVVRALGLPVVVKPRDGSSAADLALCSTVDEAAAAVEAVLAGGRDSALVEEFLAGDEISVFAYRVAGHSEVISCLQAKVGPPPKFVKLGADYPGTMNEDTESAVADLTDRALAAVGLDNWVATVQMMLTERGPVLMEINPRVPGGQTVELISATSGYEPTLVAGEVALGRRPTPSEPRASHAWYRCLTFDTIGRLYYNDVGDGLTGLETTIPPVVDMDVAPGDVVLPINHPRGGVFGRIVLCGNSYPQLERDYARILQALDLRLEALSAAEEQALWRPQSRCC